MFFILISDYKEHIISEIEKIEILNAETERPINLETS